MYDRQKRMRRLIWMAPAAILGMVIFTFIGGEVVKLLWNWLGPELFGLRQITFWQALGLLALCRILFGGFGLGGGSTSRRRMRGRTAEGWERMTPDERERFRQGAHGRDRCTTPLDSQPGA